jgi:hypothetical protein
MSVDLRVDTAELLSTIRHVLGAHFAGLQ